MIEDVLTNTRNRMDKAIDAAKDDFATIRTGRPNPQLFSKVLVSYYGTPTPLAQLASLSNAEARTLLVTPYDKSSLRDIEQAIRDIPNLGTQPSNDGVVIRVTLPELTQERRKEFVKIVRAKAEDARVNIRNIRRKSKDELEALKSEVGDDDVSRAEKELESITKKSVELVEEAFKRKESELLEV